MFKNYLKIAIRNFRKQKLNAFINVAGLAVGMACCLLILLFVKDELSYDRFHEKSDRIYRMVMENSVVTPGTLPTILQENFPQVQQVTRLYTANLWGRSALLSHENRHFYTDGFFMVDPNFFDMFTFSMLAGNPARAFTDPASIVITQEMATKYFGDENPLGKVLVYENQYEFKVTGVVANVPHNAHFHFDFLAPLENYRRINAAPNGLEQWYNHAFVTYLLLSRDAGSPAELEAQLPAVIERYAGEDFDFAFSLQPLTSIHLHSHLRREIEANSAVRYVYLFSAVAVLILAIACINFMNLTTARSLTRSREVGLRKVVGASRSQLIRQFLGESILMSLLALAFAVLLVELLLPAFNALTGKAIALDLQNQFSIITAAVLVTLMLIVGVLAGSYPAFFLSAFKPVTVLKGTQPAASASQLNLGRGLVILQFAITIGLIVCALVIAEQMAFVQNKNLGFAKEQVVVIPTRRSEQVIDRVAVLQDKLAGHAAVVSVAASSHTPGRGLFRRGIKLAGAQDKATLPIHTLWVDHDFLDTYQMSLAAGRNFSKEMASDANAAFVLNETAARELGFDSPEAAIGRRVSSDRKVGEIIGVARDFHFMSLHSAIDPIVMHIDPNRFYYISARIRTEKIRSTLAAFESTWQTILPHRPFEYFFLDEDFAQQYEAEKRLGTIFLTFSALAILIACLGLFGLATFAALQRIKEIGIRKVLGATVANVTALLSKDFVKLVLLANLIAWPAAWFAMNKWLRDFAYRIEISWWIFVLAGGLALVIALLTVSMQAIKAALANPVESLRYE